MDDGPAETTALYPPESLAFILAAALRSAGDGDDPPSASSADRPEPAHSFLPVCLNTFKNQKRWISFHARNHSFTATGETPMRKLRLDVDTIAVDSFDLAETRPAGEGTVLAQEAVTTPCACTVCMTCSTCDLSCVDGGC
jgi:hypothetical protein